MIAITATVVLIVLFNALYVSAEFSTVSARRTRVNQVAASGNRLAKHLLHTLENSRVLDRTIAACQVGITASSLVLGAYGQNVIAVRLTPLLITLGKMAEPAAHSLSITCVLLLLTGIQMVVGELLPKSVALQYPEDVALATVMPMRWSLALFRPFIWILNGSGNLLLKLFGREYTEHHTDVHSPEEISLLVADVQEDGLLDSEAQHMLRNTLRLRDLVARQVMTPRIRMITAPDGSTVTDLMRITSEAGYSRVPVFRNTIDNVVGVIHAKDLLRLHVQGSEDSSAAVREVIYIHENLPILEVWRRLEENNQYIAMVFDEHGGTAGMITYEDLIEEIFGELQDEFDKEMPFISVDKAGRIYLRADMLLSDVNEYFGLNLPHEEPDTLGGLVFDELGRLPMVGDEVALGSPEVTFRVESTKAMGISEVSLPRPVNLSAALGQLEVTRRDQA